MIETCLLEKRNCYGNDRYFPKCDKSRQLLHLMGKNSFASWELQRVRDLGYIIQPYSWSVDENSTEPAYTRQPWDWGEKP